MRSDYQVDWNKVKASLPPRSKLVKNAFGLAKLSDDAWGLFLNKNVNEDLASLVGSILDNKKIHNKVLASLMNRRFNNLQEMENVINSIKNSAVVKSQQETLFGTDFIEESLFIEKAQLVSYVTSNKKRLKQAFETIVKSDKDLSAAGNILKKEQNIEQGIENAKILEKLNILSTRVGKLSDDLNASAKILKEGNVAEARQSAQEAIQRAVERGDFDRNFVSGPIRDNAVETPTRTISKIEKPEVNQRTIEEAKSFDDIQNNTKGIEKQTNDYDNQLFGEELPQTKGRTKINTEEQKLVDEIKNADPTDANVQKYENSSLYKNKLEEAKKFEINTNERPGYVADETADFWKTRDYGNFGVGLENFIKKFYGSGAAKKEKKLVIVMGPTASGKSSVINKDYKNYGAYLADSDEIKKVLPEFEGGLNANGVHPESSFINTRILERAAQNGDNIIYPTTGREASKLNNVITEFEKAGYNIEVVNVKINANEAKLRNIARTFTGNRVISNNLLDEKTLKKIENNYINIKDEYKSKQIDNSQRTSTKDVEGLQDSRSRILLKNFEEEIEQVAQRLDPETKIPGNRIINQETGETQVEEITIRSMLDDEAQDTALINRMKDCV
jgi:predicted ABC-type ATPase